MTPEPGSLAPYAAHDERTRGRRHPEPAPRHRTEYQRDRDRIIHSNAFRRLVYKTQVFVNHEGDLYRTRITHSMEVAQIARTIARAMRLNETLAEAVSLAHDLGHTPFGHAGQDALNACMREHGGFEHNLQSLRVVDVLEERYAEFDGLNLTFEVREGILKHCSVRNARDLGDVGIRFIERTRPGLEAQLANLADEIAYNNHDIDDGIRAGLIALEDLEPVTLVREQTEKVRQKYPQLRGRRLVHETIRRMVDALVSDVIEESSARIAAAAPANIEAVRAHADPLIGMSESMHGRHEELKLFLRERVYRHYKVVRMTSKARRVITDLFERFTTDSDLLPDEHRAHAREAEARGGKDARARVIADYIAGMTDRYAILEHRRLLDPGERS